MMASLGARVCVTCRRAGGQVLIDGGLGFVGVVVMVVVVVIAVVPMVVVGG